MDFFEHQDNARRRTKLLTFYFFLAVLTIVLAIYLAFALVFLRPEDPFDSWAWLWRPELILYVALGTVAVIAAGSTYKIAQLSQGGAVIATLLGGRKVDSSTTDLDERKLMNVVEEMSIASGMPVPEVYLLDQEMGVNAFAAGFGTQDAVVGVTRGCMELLSRDELQGVIAHEFSHILNGDMRLNLRLIGLLHGILVVALIGRLLVRPVMYGRASRGGGRQKGGGGAIILFGLAIVAIGSIGIFFGRLIKSAVSRQREFLADAAAVQFTRNPDGIAGALKKIGGLVHGSRLETPKAEEASHMFFGNGLGNSIAGLFSTHPPLNKRIKRIDPSFDGQFPKVKRREEGIVEPGPARPGRGRRPVIVQQFAGEPGAPAAPPRIRANEIISQVGSVSPQHLAYAEALREDLPEELTRAAHEIFGAVALVYSLLLSPDETARAAQFGELRPRANPVALKETERLHSKVADLEARLKMPLVDLAVPALRGLSHEQYRRFRGNVQLLIESDSQIDLFEYALQKILVRHLDPHFQKVKRPVVQYYSIRGLLDETAVLLSALAHVGHSDPDERQQAFRAGAAQLPVPELAFLPFERCNLPDIDRALDKFGEAAPAVKKVVLNACAFAVASDGEVRVREAELLRAIADAFDCPLPPFVGAI